MIADALKWGESLIIEEKLRKKFNTHNSYHLFNPQVGKIPWRREWLPTPVFWPGEFLEFIVHGVTKSWTRLSSFHFHFH